MWGGVGWGEERISPAYDDQAYAQWQIVNFGQLLFDRLAQQDSHSGPQIRIGQAGSEVRFESARWPELANRSTRGRRPIFKPSNRRIVKPANL